MLNQVSIMGRLTADPDLKTTPNGINVVSFTVAVNRSYVSKGAERQADFIDCVAWRSTADFIARYFKKGQMIAVTGSIQTRNYTDRDGNSRKACEINAENVYFCESKAASAGPSAPSYGAAPSYAPAEDVSSDYALPDDSDFPF